MPTDARNLASNVPNATDTPISGDQFVSQVIDHGKITKQQIIIVALCVFFNMLDGFDITAMAVVANPVATELGLEPDRLGLIFSFALAGMMMGAMLLAPLSDIIGRRKMIITSVLMVGFSVLATVYATTLTEFVILRFISGLGAGAMLASQATLAAEYAPEKYRSLAVTVVTAGYPLGATMTSVIASLIIPEHGWRGMFIFGGTVTVAMAFVAFLLMPESLKFLFEKRPTNAIERINKILGTLKRPPLAELPAPNHSRTDTKQSSGILNSIMTLLTQEHRRSTVVLWVSFFMCFSALYFLMSWIPKMMQDAGYSIEVARQAFLLFNLGGVVGIVSLGWLASFWRLTNLVCFFLIAASIAMTAFASIDASQTLMLALIFIIGICQQGGFTGLYAAAAKIYPTKIRSTGIGWAIGLGRFGAVVGPALAGVLLAQGVSMGGNFYVFAVPMLLGGIMAYRLRID